jgi:hypothetical protein
MRILRVQPSLVRAAVGLSWLILAACGGSTESSGGAGAAGAGGFGGTAGNGGGAGTAGTGGTQGDDAGAPCPQFAPTVGTACSEARQICAFGNICCGGGYICQDGTWQFLPVGCACIQPRDASSDGHPCGALTCSAEEFCVHPANNACGPAPECVADDGGACPIGTHWESFCHGGSPGGCVEDPSAAPPYCATLPSTCGPSAEQCSCFPSNACGGGADSCQRVQDHDVYCVCLAP